MGGFWFRKVRTEAEGKCGSRGERKDERSSSGLIDSGQVIRVILK